MTSFSFIFVYNTVHTEYEARCTEYIQVERNNLMGKQDLLDMLPVAPYAYTHIVTLTEMGIIHWLGALECCEKVI